MCSVVTLKMIPPKSILSFGFQGKSLIFQKNGGSRTANGGGGGVMAHGNRGDEEIRERQKKVFPLFWFVFR